MECMKDSFHNWFPVPEDPLVWSRDGIFSFGKFSYAAVPGNINMEDRSQIEIGCDSIFFGVYDGHGGPEASQYVSENLFNNVLDAAMASNSVDTNALFQGVTATEEGFMARVQSEFSQNRLIASKGSCLLAGIIWRDRLYVANLGDSRAVCGSYGDRFLSSLFSVQAVQLTVDQNVTNPDVRQRLVDEFPDDPNIVRESRGSYRVKGIIQITGAIGDAYLKRQEYAFGPGVRRFHVPDPITRPVISSSPLVYTRHLQPNDKFVIFATDGLWEFLTNERAAQIVRKHSEKPGVAKRLIREALKIAAKSYGMKYEQLVNTRRGERRPIHDDISVIVVCIKHDQIGMGLAAPQSSIKAFSHVDGGTNFNRLLHLTYPPGGAADGAAAAAAAAFNIEQV